MNSHAVARRLALAVRSLKGLSIGDAVGKAQINRGMRVPEFSQPPWRHTDDTEMAIAIVELLAADGAIDQDALAGRFAARFSAQPERGYGAVAYWILSRMAEGHPWREIASTPYGGSGSLGNGAAMRAAPLGAYYADDSARVVEEAERSAAITHAHPQGRAGAIAVAAATALAIRHPASTVRDLAAVAAVVSETRLREAIERASQFEGVEPRDAGERLGTGRRITALDTVPFALWAAFSHLGDLGAAIHAAVAGFTESDADGDTICAIVGGVTAPVADPASIPTEWLAAAEPLSDDFEALSSPLASPFTIRRPE